MYCTIMQCAYFAKCPSSHSEQTILAVLLAWKPKSHSLHELLSLQYPEQLQGSTVEVRWIGGGHVQLQLQFVVSVCVCVHVCVEKCAYICV